MRLLLTSILRSHPAKLPYLFAPSAHSFKRFSPAPALTRLRNCSDNRLVTMATAKDVQDALQKLLASVDPNTSTERKIREQLATQLGDISEHKKLIKDIIDDYLTEQVKGNSGGMSQQDHLDPAASPAGKRRRAASDDEQPNKQQRSISSEGAPQGGIMLDTQGLKWASISNFKGQQYVNIRNYFRAKDTGALGPTRKGISLNPTVWAALQEVLPQLRQALSDENEDFAVQLSDKIKATLNIYQGKLQVDIREYYEDGGDLKPGMKGISLQAAQFESLVEAVPELNKQLSSSNTNRAAPPAAAAPAAAAAAAPSRAAAGPAAGSSKQGSSGSTSVDLGGKKRAAISDFGGGGVDLREMYEKDGQMLPGKKGILLKNNQWKVVCDAADNITRALQSHDMHYKLELGNKRTVQLSEFKRQYYVAIREYYEKDGKLAPGAKGCNLTADQWYKLVEGMAQLNEHLK